jgi:hypothetical protein
MLPQYRITASSYAGFLLPHTTRFESRHLLRQDTDQSYRRLPKVHAAKLKISGRPQSSVSLSSVSRHARGPPARQPTPTPRDTLTLLHTPTDIRGHQIKGPHVGYPSDALCGTCAPAHRFQARRAKPSAGKRLPAPAPARQPRSKSVSILRGIFLLHFSDARQGRHLNPPPRASPQTLLLHGTTTNHPFTQSTLTPAAAARTTCSTEGPLTSPRCTW